MRQFEATGNYPLLGEPPTILNPTHLSNYDVKDFQGWEGWVGRFGMLR